MDNGYITKKCVIPVTTGKKGRRGDIFNPLWKSKQITVEMQEGKSTT
jgi:hypothetical protein